jgi:hypothetical protein
MISVEQSMIVFMHIFTRMLWFDVPSCPDTGRRFWERYFCWDLIVDDRESIDNHDFKQLVESD